MPEMYPMFQEHPVRRCTAQAPLPQGRRQTDRLEFWEATYMLRALVASPLV